MHDPAIPNRSRSERPVAALCSISRIRWKPARASASWLEPFPRPRSYRRAADGLGMGDKFDDTSGKELTAGGYATMPAKMRHYGWTKGETVVQINGMGPFKLIYVNPADDPSGMQGKTGKKKAAKS